MSKNPQPRSTTPDPVARRTRFGVFTVVLLTAVTASCVLAGVLAARYSVRLDVTSTRQHALSPRTKSVLGALSSPHEIVVSANLRSRDPRARQKIADLLEEFAEASPQVRIRWIDTGDPQGQQQFRSLLTDLCALHSEAISRHQTTLSSAAAELALAAQALPELADSIKSIGASFEVGDERRNAFDQLAAVVRAMIEQFSTAEASLQSASSSSISDVLIPAADEPQTNSMPQLAAAAGTLNQIAGYLRNQASQTPTDVSQSLTSAATLAERIRDQTARIEDSVSRLKPLEPLLIARALQTTDVVLVFSPNGTTAINFDSLFPESAAFQSEQTSSAEIRFAGEELIATALASLNSNVTPIVVFVHGEENRLLDAANQPTAIGRRVFQRLFEHLRLRRIDVAEWPVAHIDEPPALLDLNPNRNRPIVWFIFPPPARQQFDQRSGTQLADRALRLGKLASVASRLAEAGESMLISTDVSDLPGIGESDPCIDYLKSFGVRVDTGRALLRNVSTPQGTLTYFNHVIDRADSDHPVARAIDGLQVILPWPCPITLDTTTNGAATWPLLSIPHSTDTWAESQWLLFRYAGVMRPFDPLRLADPPTASESRDQTQGPWIVAAAAEKPLSSDRISSESSRTHQRIVVVSSPSWFGDLYTTASDRIAGRNVWRYPGNLELLDASVYWLAEQDELISPSARILDIARIAPLDATQLRVIRWSLIAGLPVAVLGIGLILRLLRR